MVNWRREKSMQFAICRIYTDTIFGCILSNTFLLELQLSFYNPMNIVVLTLLPVAILIAVTKMQTQNDSLYDITIDLLQFQHFGFIPICPRGKRSIFHADNHQNANTK